MEVNQWNLDEYDAALHSESPNPALHHQRLP